MSRQKARALWQMTLDDDYNVPDSMPDVQHIILRQGTLEITECKPEKDRAKLRGSLNFSVFYGDNSGEQIPSGIQGKIPFEEQIHMEGIQDGENIQVKWSLEDLSISLVHSRKFSVKALITFVLTAEELWPSPRERTWKHVCARFPWPDWRHRSGIPAVLRMR